MRILITGGMGFIGSHLAEALVEKGHEVAVIDNLVTGRATNLDSLGSAVTKIEGDIADPMVWNKFLPMFVGFVPEIIIHAAASYKNPQDWSTDAATNVVGTAMVAEYAKKNKVKRIIYFQTSLCYGLRPIPHAIPVDYPCNPQGTSYAITKTAGEQLLFLSGLDVVSLRLANHCGKRNCSGPLPVFYSRLSDGKACFVMDTRRDFVFVPDLVRLVLRIVSGEGNRGVYHVSSGTDFHIRELYDGVRKAMGLSPDPDVKIVPRGADDAPTLLIDPSKTHADFPGWHTEVGLEEGIKSAVDWYKEFGVTQTYTHLKMEKD